MVVHSNTLCVWRVHILSPKFQPNVPSSSLRGLPSGRKISSMVSVYSSETHASSQQRTQLNTPGQFVSLPGEISKREWLGVPHETSVSAP